MTLLHRILLISLAAAATVAARAADDLKTMAGSWRPVKAEYAGEAFPATVLQTITMVIGEEGATYQVTVMTDKGPSVDKGTVALESKAKPKKVTVTGVEGPNAGKTFTAIYEFLHDGTLRICYDMSGQKYPKEFKSLPNTQLYLVDYQRLK